MRKKNAVLLVVLAAVMAGVFLGVANLRPPRQDQGTVAEEGLGTEEGEALQELGVPESPGYAWDDAAGAKLIASMDISEVGKCLVYYFSVPEDAGKYGEGIARELLGGDYVNAEVSSRHMNKETFPGWGDTATYQLRDGLPAELAVSLYHVSYTDSRRPGEPGKGEGTDLAGLTEEYLEKFQWGLWDGAESCSFLEEKNGSVEVYFVLSNLMVGQYADRSSARHKDGYTYDNSRGKMLFSYRGGRLSGLDFVFSGVLGHKEALEMGYASAQEILDAIKAGKEKEMRQVNAAGGTQTYILFEPSAVECCYIIGLHPENPGYKASPWVVVTGTEKAYLFSGQKWSVVENVHTGINLETGEVRDLIELRY